MANDKAEIKQTILKEIVKTEKLIQEYKEMTRPVEPDCAIGRISRMDAINNQSVTKASLRLAEEKLKKLHIVLSKIGDKDFGLCLSCKQPIPIGRIMIRPESMHCVKCAK